VCVNGSSIFQRIKIKENKEWKEKSTVETKIETLKKMCLWFLILFLKQSKKNERKFIATNY